ARLQSHGIAPWLDETELIPGERWDERIVREVRHAGAIIVCLSNRSIHAKRYVRNEIILAIQTAGRKRKGSIFVIPVKLEPCESPKELDHLHWCDYFRRDGFQKLMASLGTRARELGIELSSR